MKWIVFALAFVFAAWYAQPVRYRYRSGRVWTFIIVAAFVCAMIGFFAMPMGSQGLQPGDAVY